MTITHNNAPNPKAQINQTSPEKTEELGIFV